MHARDHAGQLNFVIFDLELTEASQEHGRVLSVGAIRLRQGMIHLDSAFHEYVNPECETDNHCVPLHGIKPDMVSSARSLGEVLDDFVEYLGKDILIAHNADFDVYFVNRHMKGRYGFVLQNVVIDTLHLSRALLPLVRPEHDGDQRFYPFGLDNLARQFDIRIGVRHTAIGDSLITALVFQRLLERLGKTTQGRLKDLIQAGTAGLT